MPVTRLRFRCDASERIGIGHVVRCLALADMLRETHVSTFCAVDLPDSVRQEIVAEGFQVEIMPSSAAFLDRLDPDCGAVLDSYGVDDSYERAVMAKCRFTAVLSDLADRKHHATILISPSPGLDRRRFRDHAALCLGPKYALLRSTFLQRSQPPTSRGGLLVCFGGSDPHNLSAQVVPSVVDGRFERVTIVTGPNFTGHQALEQALARVDHGGIAWKGSLTAHEMAAVMRSHEYSLVPASGLMLESLASNCVTIAGISASNQERFYRGFLNLGAVIGAGDFGASGLERSFDRARVLASNKEWFATMSNVIDGRSAERYRKVFSEVSQP